MKLTRWLRVVRGPVSNRIPLRRSTAVMAVLFVGLGVLWLTVRTNDSGSASSGGSTNTVPSGFHLVPDTTTTTSPSTTTTTIPTTTTTSLEPTTVPAPATTLPPVTTTSTTVPTTHLPHETGTTTGETTTSVPGG